VIFGLFVATHFTEGEDLKAGLWGSLFIFLISMATMMASEPFVRKNISGTQEEIAKAIRILNKQELPRNQYWEHYNGTLMLHFRPHQTQ
jgi:Cys-tRNA synthase (O-phospho-L-seryl-tRNA:Cys-tRNA synthase)